MLYCTRCEDSLACGQYAGASCLHSERGLCQMRASCYHKWHDEGLTGYQTGALHGYGCWFYPFTRGSNLWVNVGRSLRALHAHDVEHILGTSGSSDAYWCIHARKMGYQSIQIASYHDQPELVLCYGDCMTTPVRTACVPDNVPVRLGPRADAIDCNARCNSSEVFLR